MFSKTITESDIFLDMPLSSQALYLHLGMQADDDGFVSPARVVRMIGSQPDDLKILIAKNFAIPFDDGLMVIRHWKENNYIQKDRYVPTIHKEKFALLSGKESGVYNLDTPCIQNVRVGKERGVKSSKGKVIYPTDGAVGEEPNGAIINSLIGEFQPINPSYTRIYKNKTQRAAIDRMMKQYGTEQLRGIIQFLQKTNGKRFAPTITTPIQLEERMGALVAFCEKIKDTSLTKPAKEIIGL